MITMDGRLQRSNLESNMSQSASRQQRRKMERDLKKQQGKLSKTPITPQTKQDPADADFITRKEMKLLVQDMQKVLNYSKLVDNHVWMLVETLDRKNILGWTDVNETESLYAQKETKKQEKVKVLLEQDLSLSEYLEAVKEDPDLPGYEKLEINPIKDLNQNPYEIGIYLREVSPDLTQEQYLEMGKPWSMTLEHFGFKVEKKPE